MTSEPFSGKVPNVPHAGGATRTATDASKTIGMTTNEIQVLLEKLFTEEDATDLFILDRIEKQMERYIRFIDRIAEDQIKIKSNDTPYRQEGSTKKFENFTEQ